MSGDPAARQRLVLSILAETQRVHERFSGLDPAPVVEAAEAITRAIRQGCKVLVFGNGGSAADAQHLAAELVGRFQRERRAYAALALSTDTSVITSVGNDYGYDRIFVRQVEALGRPGDVAMAVSASGQSPNVVTALAAARAQGLTTVALTGRDGGRLASSADIHINVPEQSAARVQEVHRTIIHIICELVEQTLDPGPSSSRGGRADHA
jgi:D-sedoheptulose 7-phosphate isomerase